MFLTKKTSKKHSNFWADAFKRLRKNRVANISFYFLVTLTFLSIFLPFVSKYDYKEMNLDFQYNFWNWESLKRGFFLGTDEFGRDILTRICYGGRISLLIAFTTVVIDGVLGVLYGAIAGYFGGKIDTIMLRIMEIIAGIPNLIYVILLMVLMGPSILSIIIAMSISRWMTMAIIVRGEVIKMKEQEFVLASRTLGASAFWILFKHILPNILGQIIVRLTFGIPVAIFYEAFLSFMGIGVPLPQASWGRMVSEGFRQVHIAPHVFIIPSVFISLTILAFNLLGDVLRDVLDPKLRR